VGDGNDWNRYNFAHLQPAVDKLGTLQAVSDAKEWLDPQGARASAALMLDRESVACGSYLVILAS
jgi:hypothetical protein